MRTFEEILVDFKRPVHLPDNELQHLSEELYTIVSCLRGKGTYFYSSFKLALEEYEIVVATLDARNS
ncbi:MAG: hypothetical protein GY928_23275 [Colwellia sp.]|nr:hypothetical protein [Colwellia sp.]